MICAPQDLAGPYTLPHSRVATANIFKLFLRTGRLEEAFSLPPIDCAEFGFRLPRGRADLVLVHKDRSATVVKFQGPHGKRHLTSGIVPLIRQAVQIRRLYDVAGVRMILAAPVAGEPNRDVDDICHVSGVQFHPLGTPEEHAEGRAARGQA